MKVQIFKASDYSFRSEQEVDRAGLYDLLKSLGKTIVDFTELDDGTVTLEITIYDDYVE